MKVVALLQAISSCGNEGREGRADTDVPIAGTNPNNG